MSNRMRSVFAAAMTLAAAGAAPGKETSEQVEKFVDAVKSARSIEEIGQAAKAREYSPEEIELIFEAIQKEPTLKEKMTSLMEAAAVTERIECENAVQELNRALVQEQAKLVDKANAAAQARYANIEKIEFKAPALPVQVTKIDPKVPVIMQAYEAGPEADAYINGHTIPARIGHRINIAGANFGAAEGRVVILAADRLVECPVHRWREHEIAIDLPIALGALIGSEVEEHTVWVKLAGSELGPTAPIRLTPLIPRITAVSSHEITPSQELVIEGEGFLNQDGYGRLDGLGSLSGKVEHEFSVDEVSYNRLDILDWHDNAIRVRVGAISGVVEQSVWLVVSNATRQSDSVQVTFRPTLEVKEIRGDAYVLNNMMRGTGLFEMLGSFFQSFIGDREEVTEFEGVELANQHTVVSARLDYRGMGAGHGAEILEHPVTGSNRPEFRFVYWADGFAEVEVWSYALVEGPLGLDPLYSR